MNDTLVFGQAPTVSPITSEEFSQAVQNRTTPLGEYFRAVTYGAFQHSIPGVVYENSLVPDDDRELVPSPAQGRSGVPTYRRTDVPLLSEEDWKQSEFYRESIPFDDRMTDARARAKAEVYDEDQYRGWLRQNRPWGVATVGAAVAGSVLGSLPDPSNYIPVFGPAFRAANASRIGLMMTRAGLGAVENAALTAVVDPVIASSRRQFGEDMTFADQLIDVALAGLFGAGVGAIHGRLERLPERFADREPTRVAGALQTLGAAADALANDMPLDVAGPFRRALMEGTTLGGRGASVDANLLARAVPSGPDVVIRNWEAKVSESARTSDPEAWVARDDLLAQQADLRQQMDTHLSDPRAPIDDLDAKISYARDQLYNAPYRERKQHQAMINRLYAERTEAVRPGLLGKEAPEVSAVRQQLQAVDFKLRDLAPRISATLRSAQETLPRPASRAEAFEAMATEAPGPTPFDRVMQETARPIADPVAARGAAPRSINAVAKDAPVISPERIAKADATVGKPQRMTDAGFRERAAEHGLDESGNFEEMAEIERLEGKEPVKKGEAEAKTVKLPWERVKETEVPDKLGLQPLVVDGDGRLYVLDKRHEEAIPAIMEGAGLDPFGPWGAFLADQKLALVTRYTPSDGVGKPSIGINVYEGGVTAAQVSALQRFAKRYGEDGEVKAAVFGPEAGYGDDALAYLDSPRDLRKYVTSGKPAETQRGPNLLTKEETAALKDADATVAKADEYAKAYQAAASCLMKAAE